MSVAMQYWVEEKAYLQFQQYFTEFLESLPLGLIWLDQQGCVKKQNKLAKILLGYQGEALGKLWREVIAQCLAPHTANGFELILKNGRRIDVTTQAAPSLEDPLRLEQVILLNDVTETRLLQQHVEQEDRYRELGVISATLSHQLRTPLATSLLYAEQIKNYDLPTEKRKNACDQMIQQLNFMNRQVNDLLFFVKGDLPVEATRAINDLIQSLLQTNKAVLNDFQLILACDADVMKDQLTCHFDGLLGALSNLMTNACDASAAGSQICVRVQKVRSHNGSHQGFYYFDVSDQGSGFTEKAKALFGLKAFSTKKDGNGIGLRFVRRVAEKHGGSLLYINQAQGACVRLAVPVKNHSVQFSSTLS